MLGAAWSGTIDIFIIPYIDKKVNFIIHLAYVQYWIRFLMLKIRLAFDFESAGGFLGHKRDDGKTWEQTAVVSFGSALSCIKTPMGAVEIIYFKDWIEEHL